MKNDRVRSEEPAQSTVVAEVAFFHPEDTKLSLWITFPKNFFPGGLKTVVPGSPQSGRSISHQQKKPESGVPASGILLNAPHWLRRNQVLSSSGPWCLARFQSTRDADSRIAVDAGQPVKLTFLLVNDKAPIGELH